MIDLYTLHKALKAAGLPIAGVTCGTVSDRSTWSVQWATPPTKAQETAAATAIAAFVPTTLSASTNLPIDGVFAWVTTKLGVNVMDATLEVLSGVIK